MGENNNVGLAFARQSFYSLNMAFAFENFAQDGSPAGKTRLTSPCS